MILTLSNKSTKIIAALLLLLMSGLAFFSLRGDSATMDELAHIPAGYSYITQKDMRLNPEHPPLLKDLAGFSIWLSSKTKPIVFPSTAKSWQNDLNGQWEFGRDLLYRHGNDADRIIFFARLPMLLVMLLLGIYLFKWTKELYGNTAGLIALFFYSLSPTFIAHSRYVTTDVGAAAAFFITIYYFVKWLKKQNKRNLIAAGFVFGLALLTKFSLVLLIPYFIFLTIIWATIKTREETSLSGMEMRAGRVSPKAKSEHFPAAKSFAGRFCVAKRCFFSRLLVKTIRLLFFLFLIGLIGMILIWPVYKFHIWNYPATKQLSDTRANLQSYGNRLLADSVIWLSNQPLLRPYGQFFHGLLMVIQRSVGGNTTYFLGEISRTGWPSYFPVVFLIKVPLALLILILLSSIAAVRKIGSDGKPLLWLKNHFDEFALLSFFALYWFISVRSTLNIGVRHVLPVFPVIYVLISGQVAKIQTRLAAFVALILFVWYVSAAVGIYPNFLSYFNELAGGPKNGYKYAVDSNLDWGQDLKRLKNWIEENEIEKIYVDYFGGGDLNYYLNNRWQAWWGNRDPKELPRKSWLAISASFLQSGRGKPAPNFSEKTDYYLWLNEYEPVKVIGNSIFIYQTN